MKKNTSQIRMFTSVALCAAALLSAFHARSDDKNAQYAHQAGNDVLAIGDAGPSDDPNAPPQHSTVKFFDARSGKLLYQLPDASGGLAGPTGIVFDDGRMIVANQNVNLPFNGEVLQYGRGIEPGTPLVSRDDPHAPLAPRGIVLVQRGSGKRLFIADMGDPNNNVNGKLLVFDVRHGKATFVADMNPKTDALGTQFRPRGLVIGPDGYLWVTLAYLPGGCGGKVVRFNPATLAYKDTVLSNSPDCSKDANHLNRPEGLAFAPNGDLFVTSFKNSTVDADIDRILILRAEDRIYRRSAPQLDFIPLDAPGQPRTSTQALVFGPGGYLYVAILQNGEVRKYDVVTKGYWTIVQPLGKLTAPFYLSFFRTDPATLAYEGDDGRR
ncbi:hypothetical protein [Caballeronia concitans]|uniref:NHL repeat protein n=1 Tax=Caballeronia concitans TaxID=1777133 RepID=A0A658QTH7_9BURK|nr:hypothetical protein [Caballeronia concitans]KIG01972.1 hypothetical protein BurMR1_1179 [Burkholderia sp. MR1]SAL20229.1 hypothetical protein AWB72_01316 [Caballeronia concitans]